MLRQVAILAGVLASVHAQSFTLTTTFQSDNGQAGVMFDVTAISGVSICGLDANVAPGTWTFRLYRLPAGVSYATQANNAAAWTVLGTALEVTSAGIDVPTTIPIAVNVAVPAGGTQAFYLTAIDGLGTRYTTGAPGSAGTIFVQDANLRIHVGAGAVYPFAESFSPRIFNGRVRYTAGSTTCPLPPFQVNQTGASLIVDGLQGDANNPAVTHACFGQLLVAQFGGIPGAAYDIAYAHEGVATSATGGLQTNGGQTVNVDVSSPTLTALYGFMLSPTHPLMPGPMQFQAPMEVEVTTAQLIVKDLSHPDGFRLSQPVTVVVGPGSGLAAGPAIDDGFASVTQTWQPLCASPVTFFGTTYSTIFVSSNGRLTFQAGSTAFAPSTAAALTSPPAIGLWADLNPESGGTISIDSQTPGELRVNYANVSLYNPPSLQVDLRITYFFASQVWRISFLNPVPASNAAAWLGVSPGTPNATDLGPQPFSPGGSGTPASANAMIYRSGTVGSVASGLMSLTFTPTLIGGQPSYSWSAN